MRELFLVVLVLAAATTPAGGCAGRPGTGWGLLLGEVLQHRGDGDRSLGPNRIPIGVHGVAGKVETGDLLFHGHQLLLGELRQVPEDQLHGFRLFLPQGEEVKLSLQVFFRRFDLPPPRPGEAVDELLIGVQQLGPPHAHGVKGPCPDEAFQHPLVQVLVQQRWQKSGKEVNGPSAWRRPKPRW